MQNYTCINYDIMRPREGALRKVGGRVGVCGSLFPNIYKPLAPGWSIGRPQFSFLSLFSVLSFSFNSGPLQAYLPQFLFC